MSGEAIAPPVILLHGTARTARSMAKIALALQQQGRRCYNWDYPSRQHDVPKLVAALEEYLRSQGLAGQQLDAVGHSLGGIVLRHLLRPGAAVTLRRLVLIGVPNDGVAALGVVRRYPLLRRIVRCLWGRAAASLYPGSNILVQTPQFGAEIGVIAGDLGFHPINPASWVHTLLHGRWHHDGTVTVASASLPTAKAMLRVRVNHSFLPTHPKVVRAAVNFLQQGDFAAISD